jgi:predicted CoA-substrate-specific enzyme activase
MATIFLRGWRPAERRIMEVAEQLYVGIDSGSVSLNCIVLNESKEIVYEAPYERHLGRVEERVFSLIRLLEQKFGSDRIRCFSFTGSHGKKLSEQLGTLYEFETISQVLGALFVQPDVRTIISMGGQDTALFQIDHSSEVSRDGGNSWNLSSFTTNGPCASGTGSFIDQQAQRLATSLYAREVDISQEKIDAILGDFVELGERSKKPANVACRCTVFTKSDMIHLQNKGETLEDIIYGLHIGNARNYMSTIVSNRVVEEPILFTGGLSLNGLQVKAFRDYFPHLIIPPHNTSLGALGVAIQALSQKREIPVGLKRTETVSGPTEITAPRTSRLTLKETIFPESNEVRTRPLKKGMKVYLGIDIGSTTTKYALMTSDREIVQKCYVPTQGKPIEVTQRLLRTVLDEMGDEIEIAGTATTGSGRNVVGDFLNADLIIDEITAHARGAVEIAADIDTIFEIGGQDSKYISIANRYPLDFDMNKVCAAGTGSFLHELAGKYGINIVGEFQDIALASTAPIKLAERCTVFMESDLVSYHQKGVLREDLIAGLCYAIVHNYLNRVVGKRKIGEKVMFLGGPSLNKGVVAAFEDVLGRAVLVPPHREVLGAYGAAISVQEKMQFEAAEESSFRGLNSAINDRMSFKEKICHADPHCHNECKLKIYDFDGRHSIWGGECGRYDVVRTSGVRKRNFFQVRQDIWKSYLDGVCEELGSDAVMERDGRPTVAMQRSLYGNQTAIFWAHFFDELGMRLILSPPTNGRISQAGIESVMAETCYPVKVSYGHVRELMGRTAYLFLPSVINMQTPADKETGYYCPMSQSNSYMMRAAFPMEGNNILSPVVHFKYDPDTLALEIWGQIRTQLEKSREEVRKAVYNALEIEAQFKKELIKKGDETLQEVDKLEPVLLVTGRPYNLYDERLNLRLGPNLAKLGLLALPMDFVDSSAVDLSDFPSMYWGLGAQILRTAKLAATHDHYFGLHLTNFSCGADSFIEHFYKHIMRDDPYLILELDEHSAVAGVMTRLEAYKNVIKNTMRKFRSHTERKVELAN